MADHNGVPAVPTDGLEAAAAHEPEPVLDGAAAEPAQAETVPSETAPGDAATTEAPPSDDDVDLPTALAQRDEYLAHARRLQADFENFRKRALKQQADQAHAATARLVESLLPVLDGFDSAVIHGIEGVAPLHKTLLEALTKAGLEVVASEGAPFDPTIHEAVLHEPAEPGEEGGEPTISEVFRTGYLWQGRTLRAAMVKVRD